MGDYDCDGSFAATTGIADTSDGSPGFSLGLSLEYQFTDLFALELLLGFDDLEVAGETASMTTSDVEARHLSLRGKLYFRSGRLRPFLAAGLGFYDLDPGSTENGYSLGLGLRYEIRKRLDYELISNYHSVESDAFDLDFVNVQTGLRFRF